MLIVYICKFRLLMKTFTKIAKLFVIYLIILCIFVTDNKT